VQTGLLGSAPPSFTGDNLVSPGLGGVPARQDRLEDAAGADGVDQLRHGFGRHVTARLKWAWLERIYRKCQGR